MRFRLVAGAWCLAAVVLTNVYNSTLMSHLFAPKYHNSVIKSFHDLVDPKFAHIQVAVKKGGGIDSLISVFARSRLSLSFTQLASSACKLLSFIRQQKAEFSNNLGTKWERIRNLVAKIKYVWTWSKLDLMFTSMWNCTNKLFVALCVITFLFSFYT